jgi:hypothetical protein
MPVPFAEDDPRPQIQTLAINEIKDHPQLRTRDAENHETVLEYTEAMANGAVFPPAIVFLIDGSFFRIDGYHRIAAARHLGLETFACEIRRGTLRDAILASSAVNKKNGLSRSNYDKRLAVGKLLGDAEWAAWSDNAIAAHCQVSSRLVAKLRAEFTTNIRSESEGVQRIYRDRHGNVRRMNIAAIGRPAEEPVKLIKLKVSTEKISFPVPKCVQDEPEPVRIRAEMAPREAPAGVTDMTATFEKMRLAHRDWLAMLERLVADEPPMVGYGTGERSAVLGRLNAVAQKLLRKIETGRRH